MIAKFKIKSSEYDNIGKYCNHKLRLTLLEHKSDAAVWRLYRKYRHRRQRIWKAINTIHDFGVTTNTVTMGDLNDKCNKYSEYMWQIREYMSVKTGRIVLEKRRVITEKCKFKNGSNDTGNARRRSGGSRPPLPTKGASQKVWWLRWFDAIRPRKNGRT
jgi:hypothetical protein